MAGPIAMPHEIVTFPDYTPGNPYQRYLYTSLPSAFQTRFGTLENAFELLEHVGHSERVIFHLHWEDAIYRDAADESEAFDLAQAFIDACERFKRAGGLLVWTIHNLTPHNQKYLVLHAEFCRHLMSTAQAVHMHSFRAIAELRSLLDIDISKIHVVPHGNYLSLTGRVESSPALSREKAELKRDDIVFLLFGRLSYYKGIDLLFDALRLWHHPKAHLVIAGKDITPINLDQLSAAWQDCTTFRFRFLPDEELCNLIKAANFVVLPYHDSLTSGSLLLAMSAGRPVIAPSLATVTELVSNEQNGLLFDEGNARSLATALAASVEMSPFAWRRLAASSRATAELYDWMPIGRQLAGLYMGLIAEGQPIGHLRTNAPEVWAGDSAR